MAEVPVHYAEFHFFNVLAVECGTNCPQGGDSGHGGRTIFKLTNLGATDWQVRVHDRYGKGTTVVDGPFSVEIVLGGDAEAQTFMKALRFAADVLEKQLHVREERLGRAITAEVEFDVEYRNNQQIGQLRDLLRQVGKKLAVRDCDVSRDEADQLIAALRSGQEVPDALANSVRTDYTTGVDE